MMDTEYYIGIADRSYECCEDPRSGIVEAMEKLIEEGLSAQEAKEIVKESLFSIDESLDVVGTLELFG